MELQTGTSVIATVWKVDELCELIALDQDEGVRQSGLFGIDLHQWIESKGEEYRSRFGWEVKEMKAQHERIWNILEPYFIEENNDNESK